ncbi:MAG: Ig-like, group 1 [Gammaproteobacteria bacterium]|nr:Ig-like, group 1 [Gammaproteobacteria bacterium]
MRIFASIAALGMVALALAGCGGASGNSNLTGAGSSGGSGGTGGNGGTGGTTTPPPTYSMGNGSGAGFQSGVIGVPPGTLSAGGTANLQVTIVDQTGTLYTGTAVNVTFNSPCVAQGLATITASGSTTAGSTAGTVSTNNGSVSATYTAKGCSGSDVITATSVVGTTGLTASGTVTVAAAAIGSVQFVSATPSSIGLKGTGLGETSTVVFKVVDSTGGPRPGVSVAFTLNTTVGGTSLSPATATSAADGTVQTVVSAGTQHTSVRVTATIAQPALSTQSSVLTVTTGLPASQGFSIAVGAPSYASAGPACPNVEAAGTDGVTVPVTVRLSDRYNNPAPDGTAVAFNTDGGHIVGACATPSSPGAADGTCTVLWTSANPRPQLSSDNPPLLAKNRAVILATAIGEESFTDTNGNGYWDPGEPFVNASEPYRDDNENGQFDSGEYFLDFNQNGKWDAGDPTAFKGITCTGTSSTSTCSTSTLSIGAQHLLIMSTGGAQIRSAPAALNLTRGATTTGTTTTYTAVTGSVSVNIQDLSGVLQGGVLINGNPMPAGTTVTIVADSAIGTISPSTSSYTIGCSTAINGQNFTSSLTTGTTAGSGNIVVTATSPGTKTVTQLFIPVTVN